MTEVGEQRVIRVAIIDDHPVVRDGTAALLAAQPGLEVVGTADGMDEARAMLAQTEVDVLLLDLRLG
jgi:DNA-binding NarL/FixJ family response regulator